MGDVIVQVRSVVLSSVFIFDPGTVHSLKGLREVVDDESVEELKLKIIDEHVERQNI